MATETRQVILDLQIPGIKSVQDLERALKETNASIKELDLSTEEGAKAFQDLSKQSAQYSNALGQVRTNQKAANDVLAQNDKTLTGLRKTLAALTAKRNDTPFAATAEFNALQLQIKATSDEIKRIEQAGGDFRRNVGNYTGSIKEALVGTTGFGKSINNLGLAFKTNPFLLLLTVLVPLIDKVRALTPLMDALNRILEPITAVINRLVGLIQEGLIKAFQNLTGGATSFSDIMKNLGQVVLDNIINRFKAFGVIGEGIVKILKGDFKEGFKTVADGALQATTGITNLTDKLAGFGQELAGAVETGRRLADLQIEIEQLEIDQTRRQAALRAEINKNKLAADDVTKSIQDRIKAAETAFRLEQEIEKFRTRTLDVRIERLKLEQTLNDTDRKGQLELAKLEAERSQAEAERFERQKDVQNKINALRVQELNNQKAIQKSVQETEDAYESEGNRVVQLTELKTEQLSEFEKLQQDFYNEQLKTVRDGEQALNEERRTAAIEQMRIDDERAKATELANQQAAQSFIDFGQAVFQAFSNADKENEAFKTALKGLSIAEIVINLQRELQAISLAQTIAPQNLATGGAYAATTIPIFSAVAIARAALATATVAAAAGGGDFVTTKPTLLMVGDNPGGRERVTVTPLSGKGKTRVHPSSGLLQMAGGGSLTVDQGLAQTSAQASANASVRTLVKAIQNMPPPVVSVIDINNRQNQRAVNVIESQL